MNWAKDPKKSVAHLLNSWYIIAKKAGYPSMRQFYVEAIHEKIEKLQKEENQDEDTVP